MTDLDVDGNVKVLSFSVSPPWRYIKGVEVRLHSVLTSVLDGDEFSALYYG